MTADDAISSPETGPDPSASMRAQLVSLTGSRLVGNTLVRMPFVFSTTIAAGLGVSVTTLGVALAFREASGLASPMLGRMVDRGRRRIGMVVALLGCGLGSIAAVFGSSIWIFGAGMALFGLAKVGYDLSMSSWIGDTVPFRDRGRVTGITELSWALAFLVGVPFAALLISVFDWRAAFVVLGVVIALSAIPLSRVIEPDLVRPKPAIRRRLVMSRHLVAVVGALAMVALSGHIVEVAYGAWMDERFGLTPLAIGGVTAVRAIGELVGSGSTIRYTDRIGKGRSVAIGMAIFAPAALLLGSASSVWMAMALLIITSLGFEFAIVSMFPLVSELSVTGRGEGIGFALGAMTVTRAIGTVAASAVYDRVGIATIGIAAGVLAVVALTTVLVWVREEDA